VFVKSRCEKQMEEGPSVKRQNAFILFRKDSAGNKEQAISSKRKLTTEVDKGLFVQHAEKHMKMHRVKVHWTPPPGFMPLSGGDSSNTFLSKDATVVYKCYLKKTEATQEWEMVKRVMALAPMYTAGPADFFLASGGWINGHGSYYILSTQYAGDMLNKRLEENLLTPEEHCLGLLQAIHFTLLLGKEILVDDIHGINICVSKADSSVEIRWIDFVKWKVAISEDDKEVCLQKNARWLLDTNNWSSWDDSSIERTCCLVNAQTRSLQGNDLKTLEEMIMVLFKVASVICARLKEPMIRERGSQLQAQITETATRLAEHEEDAAALECIKSLVFGS
jgi:hypothetical protein